MACPSVHVMLQTPSTLKASLPALHHSVAARVCRAFPSPRAPGGGGERGAELPHPNDVAVLHNQVARDVAKGAGGMVLVEVSGSFD